ncbi:hypothetical protein V7D15_13035 [Thermoanaerobacter thermohydrosulfuricus]
MSKILYVPILKWKKGEQEALKNLFSEQKNKIIPLIEIIEEEPKVILDSLRNCYENPIFIDTIQVEENDRSFLSTILNTSKQTNQQLYPVLYFNDLNLDTLPQLLSLTNRIAIKIPVPEDIEGPTYSELFNTIKTIKSNYTSTIVDIILDVGIITEKNIANILLTAIKEVLNHYLLKETFYNSIIISSTSLPEDLSSLLQAGDKKHFPRYDIKLFYNLIRDRNFTSIADKFIYSDYGVTKFTDSDIDFSRLKYSILPKVRYTTYDEYIVLKGKRDHTLGKNIKDYADLASEILNSNYYFGENFSFGDSEIKERATGKKGPGNHTQWVTISANHHIAVVVSQLSNFSI